MRRDCRLLSDSVNPVFPYSRMLRWSMYNNYFSGSARSYVNTHKAMFRLLSPIHSKGTRKAYEYLPLLMYEATEETEILVKHELYPDSYDKLVEKHEYVMWFKV